MNILAGGLIIPGLTLYCFNLVFLIYFHLREFRLCECLDSKYARVAQLARAFD